MPVAGWDFSWFDGRATEERPPWGYAKLMGERMAQATAALDIQTGGGEVLATVPRPPALLAATESWPPNVQLARQRLAPLGASVAEVADDAGLPFGDGSFDLVVSRHPTAVLWAEIARVLCPGGCYLSQQIGAGSNRELIDAMMGPQVVSQTRSTDAARAAAQAAGLTVTGLQERALRVEFSTSPRWCTSCARCCGPCPGSPWSVTARGSPRCTSRSSPGSRSSRFPSGS